MISGALEPEFWGIGMAFAENRLSDRSGGALLDSGDVERINFLRVFLVLEPNSKRVERFQLVVVLSGRQTERSHACPGLKPLAGSIGGLERAMQAT